MHNMVDKSEASWLGQLRRGVADRCVLALLEHREWYGFDLAKTLSQAQVIAGEGTIYPLLSRLRRAGLVDVAGVHRRSAAALLRPYAGRCRRLGPISRAMDTVYPRGERVNGSC